MRLIIKKVYMLMITLLNFIYKSRQVDKKQITVLMTFPEDVMPIINELDNKGYKITVIAKFEEQYGLKHLNNITFIPAGNKYIVKHIKALSSSKVILIDTYYLMLGGYTKKKTQTIIQTWHASGALKNFGLTDHQVDLTNVTMVRQYQRVYQATDYYLIGGKEMGTCFKESFEATEEQLLPLGLPRLSKYLKFNLKAEQERLKKHYNIHKKLVVYVPTYREGSENNRQIDVARFEEALPEYTLINQLHPSISKSQSIATTQELMIMADVIISDYSSLPIEASLLDKPTLFYVYDEHKYDKIRGLNQFYKAIPQQYKVTTEEELILKIRNDIALFKPLFKNWHKYNREDSVRRVTEFIEKMVKR
ncbi:teichoic acid glycerol-phosphate primase TarB [Staphylococcus haemolyticus]|uniref:teichoic acid glycerol-phosphate primase TarB n=1 Tax=Staphylococcus haemolyticus TaxID=1283 RepID=UPI00069CED9C|nr:teichoic acid glycerol-phosphate primase TarB [Staphylococcus haemolyticus]MBY6180246.1 CDP-glycerol glycerophosphotransferase family protein [Staphylococcaceae bacterium DP2N0-1]MCH4381354.1 CDP-glycerol glycerophosphotransferase family protein [Staphylococcus haemolyticus]MCH4388824.1 CDP-glycerol glycerophosphotransferase family protein [Staphylococcus haemolyticus]MCH4402943.1 CDP-glycerol glycerophosphotransferase family protein [Staphylococcus haemolyticus]MCH4517907.1 CDP-glycerol gl